MGNKQSYNVADANVQHVKTSTNGESVESEVACTYDTAKGINMKPSNNDGNHNSYDILYRIEPLPHIPVSYPPPPVVHEHEIISTTSS
uniref:Uncharacterized protein n=1 Tax=Panagrolaimus davidi TaxID=227884 RepID=A0A914NZV5_9BILA